MNYENYTLGIIKPTAVAHGNSGKIIARIESESFRIHAMKTTHLNIFEARKFYAVHSERDFFEELCQFLASGKVTVLVLEKENAVAAFRKLIGDTNPADAKKGTIRRDFGLTIGQNAIHGSDSLENAKKEVSFFFSSRALI